MSSSQKLHTSVIIYIVKAAVVVAYFIKYMPIIVLILLALSGGASYLSNTTLPGDALYPVKVSINEPIEEALAFGPKALSEVHTQHALERLHELEALQNNGTLSRREEVLLKYAFENEVSKVNADIGKLNSTNDYLAARTVEKTLRQEINRNAVARALYSGPDGSVPSLTASAARGGAPNAADVASTIIPDATTPPTSVSPSSSPKKYVPKLLPQRPNISREDDGGEDD